MEVMASRNLRLIYVSRKRMIFEMWRHVLKMEKAFCYSVKNVLQKSLLKEGFDTVNQAYRNDLYTERGHRLLLRS